MADLFDRDALRNALEELVARLLAQEARGSIQIIGGAALSLCYFDRRTTTDIDARVRLDMDVRGVVAAIAERHGWGDEWFNDAAASFIPAYGRDVDWVDVFERDGLVIQIASAEALLAMKLHANRPGRDGPDIARLMVVCGLSSIEEADSLYETYYSGDALTPRALRLVEQVLLAGLPHVPDPPAPLSFP